MTLQEIESRAAMLLHELYSLRCAVDSGKAPTHEQLANVRRAASEVATATLQRPE